MVVTNKLHEELTIKSMAAQIVVFIPFYLLFQLRVESCLRASLTNRSIKIMNLAKHGVPCIITLEVEPFKPIISFMYFSKEKKEKVQVPAYLSKSLISLHGKPVYIV